MSFTTDYFTSKRKNYIFNHELCFNSLIIYVNEITSGEVKLNPTAFVWNVATTYKLNQKHYLSAGANTAFSSPNIDDMRTLVIVDFRCEIPSKDLSPEKSMNYEFGYKADYDDFYACISVFRNNPTDFITRVRCNLDGKDSVSGYPVFLKETLRRHILKLPSLIQFLDYMNLLLQISQLLIHTDKIIQKMNQ